MSNKEIQIVHTCQYSMCLNKTDFFKTSRLPSDRPLVGKLHNDNTHRIHSRKATPFVFPFIFKILINAEHVSLYLPVIQICHKYKSMFTHFFFLKSTQKVVAS